MITLLSIRLRNFRKVREGTFVPLEQGVTGLSGANGAGKSSFLSAAVWALYGVRPDDVPTAALRRQGSSYKDECSVSVLFRHGGQIIEVVRELRGKNNRTIMNIFVDGKEQTVTTPSFAEKWIRDRLKIDPEAFTTAFVVRQKELDSLVDARPAERRATIERLSGIEKMSLALKTARSEENEAKNQIKTMNGSEEEVSLAASLVEEKKEMERTLAEQVQQIQESLQELQKQEEQAVKEYEEATQNLSRYERAESEIQLKRSRVAHITSLLERAREELATHTPNTHEEMDLAELVERGKTQAAQKDEIQKNLEDAQAALVRYESTVSSLQNSINAARDEVSTHEKRVASLAVESGREDELLAQKAEVEAEMSTLVDSNLDIEREIASLVKQRSLLQRSIDMLGEHEHEAECPTCHSRLADPSALIADLTEQAQNVDESRILHETTLDEQKSALNKHQERLRGIESSLDAIAEEKRALTTAQEALESARTRLDRLQGDLDKMTAEKPSEEAVSNLRESLDKLNASLEETRSLYQSVRMAERNKARRMQLESEISAHESELAQLTSELADYEEFLGSLPVVTQEEVDAIKQSMNAAVQRTNTEKQRLTETEYNLGISRERLQTAERDYQNAVSDYEKKKAALVLVSQKAAVSDVLDEFRKNRIASIAPELSETATSLISAMTNGYYTEVLLDENFTPSVVDVEGNERPVSWLSGGEESVVALALRIAIGDLMTGGEGGLLWLDEVLTAQDASRRSSLLNTLRNLTGRQIVMINHTPDANDMVDKIVTIKETDDGSVIDEETVIGEDIVAVEE